MPVTQLLLKAAQPYQGRFGIGIAEFFDDFEQIA